jgi:hypothetical protein
VEPRKEEEEEEEEDDLTSLALVFSLCIQVSNTNSP